MTHRFKSDLEFNSCEVFYYMNVKTCSALVFGTEAPGTMLESGNINLYPRANVNSETAGGCWEGDVAFLKLQEQHHSF